MIADFLVRLEAALKRLPNDERQAVLDEVGAHLRQHAADLQQQGMSAAEAEAAAVERFGTPEEIAAGYDEAEGVVRRPTGEVVLDVTKAVGRGAGKAAVGVGKVAGKGFAGLFKFVGAAVITAMIVAGAIAVAAIVFADDWAPYIQEAVEDSVGRQLYDGDLGAGIDNETFYAPPAETLTVSWRTWDGHGCSTITMWQPDGPEAFRREVCGDTHGQTTLAPVSGTWRVSVEGAAAGDGWLMVSYRPADP